MSLSVSAFYPDAQLKESKFSQDLINIAISLAKFKDNTSNLSIPEIELHFLLSGKHENPNFTGMRLRHFDRDSQNLCIEAAVPEKINYSTHAHRYIIAAMLDAVENASIFLNEEKVTFDLPMYMALIESCDTSQQ